MSDYYLGEIRMFAGDYAPQDWAFCDGQVLQISEYTQLFALIGVVYGGDGQTTFALPDMRGRVPVSAGPATAGTYVMGQSGGAETVTLTSANLPAHTHAVNVQSAAGTLQSPTGNVWAGTVGKAYQDPGTTNLSTMNPQMLSSVGGNLPHENMMPFMPLSFIIALEGTFPSFD